MRKEFNYLTTRKRLKKHDTLRNKYNNNNIPKLLYR